MSAKYKAGERQRKRESRRQAQREKGRQRSRARDRKQMRQFFVERTTHENFVAARTKIMRNASRHRCKVKMSSSEKKGTRTRMIFPP